MQNVFMSQAIIMVGCLLLAFSNMHHFGSHYVKSRPVIIYRLPGLSTSIRLSYCFPFVRCESFPSKTFFYIKKKTTVYGLNKRKLQNVQSCMELHSFCNKYMAEYESW